MSNTIYVDRTTVVDTPSVQDFNDATYGRLGHVFWGGDAGGTSSAITFTTSPAPNAYAAGQVYRCRITAANPGAVTVNANLLGVKNLVLRGGGALVANVLQVGDVIDFIYDAIGNQFQIISARPGANYDINQLYSVVAGSVFRKNCIINGAMRLAQRGTSFAAAASGIYSLDRWLYGKAGTMVHTLSQDTDVPTVAQAGRLITHCLRLQLTTPQTSIGATDICNIGQRIEGYNFQRIAQRPFTASFWVKATLPGIYSLIFLNNGLDRSYVANFTIAAANTYQEITVNVPASPTGGTWNYTNGVGLFVAIVLACGSTYYTTPGTWQTGLFEGTASNINGVNTGATDFRFTEVQVEPGSVATEFDLLDIETDFSNARRYYWKTFPYATAPAQNTGVLGGCITYRAGVGGVASAGVWVPHTLMRAQPTYVTFNPNAANANWRNRSLPADSGAASTDSNSEGGFYLNNVQVAGDLVTHQIIIHVAADAEL